jgi:hypothetical protein
MDDGAKSKKTGMSSAYGLLYDCHSLRVVFVGGVAEEIDEAAIYEHFSTFGAVSSAPRVLVLIQMTAGDIIEVQLPSSATNPTLQAGRCDYPVLL